MDKFKLGVLGKGKEFNLTENTVILDVEQEYKDAIKLIKLDKDKIIPDIYQAD